MINYFISTIFYFSKGFVLYAFNIETIDKPLYYSIKNLFVRVSYRLPESANKDYLIVLRSFKRAFQKMLIFKDPAIVVGNNSTIAVYDTDSNSYELRIDYLKRLTDKEPKIFIPKDKILNSSGIVNFIFSTILLFLITLPLYIISLFSSNKSKYGLLVFQMIESFNLLVLLQNHKINLLHYFCIFEPDSNICAYILQKKGYHVNKVASEVPMFLGNQIVVANELSFCFRYQLDEFKYYKDTMFVKSTQLWVPEQVFLISDKYTQNRFEQNTNTIGFYSSGMWLRKMLGDADSGLNEIESEQKIMNWLVEYIKLTNQYSLKIFLHPLEKNKKNFVHTQNHYKEYLQNPNVSYSELDKRTAECFNEINIAVSLYSTINFERIFLGFKTIIAPLGMNGFPLSESNFSNICAKSKEELFRKLDLNLTLSPKEYFEKNNLMEYTNESSLK